MDTGIKISNTMIGGNDMWLRYGYHLLCAFIISALLLITTMVMDVLLQSTHLTQLLLNIDFLVDPKNVPTIVEGLIHLCIGFTIYVIFLIIYQYSKSLYYLAYFPLIVIFIIMYPFLIAIAQRSFFTFSWSEYFWWMVAHIIFMVLMAICIPTISNKHL
ncbi:hypothetical protein HMPREF0793_0700 [Staphylococcus caprae M23864:W1]|nr:hypothetical protein HMPREF0793_0700 [Staphylococcus caprae M23864:W1]